MQGMAQKESEEQPISGKVKPIHLIRKTFWTEVLEHLKNRSYYLYNNISPFTVHWLCVGSGISSV
ncbi:DUF4268 domain-containing protein [Providencia rettgeri]|nr:hypothetical protein BML2531_11860 [Providencia rettgeri]